MSDTYMGFKVKLQSSQLGQVIGTVCSVTETKIELSNAILNGKGPQFPLISVESQFVQDIRILAVKNDYANSLDESSDDVSRAALHEGKTNGGRARRRELLRSIPNTCNAYVCPESPPLIHRTSSTPGLPDGGVNHNDNGQRQPKYCLLQKPEGAPANVKLTDRPAVSQSKKHHPEERSGRKWRNFSMSEGLLSSEVSGTESDSVGFSAHSCTFRGLTSEQTNGANGCRQNWSSRGHSGHRVGGNRQQQQTASGARWDEVRVEDFIDEDFDFEKNLALFDKNAFYEMVDMKKCVTNRITRISSVTKASSSSAMFDEGPDGVGVPLIGDVAHSIRVSPHCAPRDYDDDCTITTNTPTESSSRRPHHPGYNLADPAPSSSTSEKDNTYRSAAVGKASSRVMADTSLSSFTNSNSVCATIPPPLEQVRLSSQDWYTFTGQRIPVLTTNDRNRLLHYLATGADPLEYHVVSSSKRETAGITWGRLLETAARSLTDHLMSLTSQTLRQTPQRLAAIPPIRVLLVPGGAHLSGALTLALARLLANRGACVLLFAPTESTPTDDPADSNTMTGVYDDELNLLLQLAPRLNQYGLEDEDDGCPVGSSGDDILDDEDDDSTDVEENKGNGYNEAVEAAADGMDDVDELDLLLRNKWLERHSGSGDRFSNRSASEVNNRSLDQSGSAVMDYSPVNRMWISRIPGLKILKKISSLSKLSTDVCVNLVVVAGMVTTTKSDVTPYLNNWLLRHQAISRLVYLLPSGGKAEKVPNRPGCTSSVVELGLPTLSPHEVANRFTPPITNRWLVDVGLTRKIVRRLTGDLKLLPPFGLFNTGSVIQLHWNRPTQDQSPALSRGT